LFVRLVAGFNPQRFVERVWIALGANRVRELTGISIGVQIGVGHEV
jgi:hypothetical protein